VRRSNLSAIGDCFVPRSDISFEVLEKTFLDNYISRYVERWSEIFQSSRVTKSRKPMTFVTKPTFPHLVSLVRSMLESIKLNNLNKQGEYLPWL